MISEKEDNLLIIRYTHIFENVFLGISASFAFHLRISGNFRFNSLLFRNSTTSLFSRTYPRKFPQYLSPFLKFRSFWLNGKSPKCEFRSAKELSSPVRHQYFFSKWQRQYTKARNNDDTDTKLTAVVRFFPLCFLDDADVEKKKSNIVAIARSVSCSIFQLCRYTDAHITEEGQSCSLYAVMLVCCYVASLKQCAINSLGLCFAVDFN